MRERWLPIGVLAGALFAINLVTRLVVRFAVDEGPSRGNVEGTASLVMFALIGVVLAVLAFVRSQRHPVSGWLPDALAATAAAMLLTILIGPFVSGGTPFGAGAGDFFLQVWLYAGFAGAGLLLGYLVATALGLDHRSQSLKRFAESKLTKPRRVVRR